MITKSETAGSLVTYYVARTAVKFTESSDFKNRVLSVWATKESGLLGWGLHEPGAYRLDTFFSF